MTVLTELALVAAVGLFPLLVLAGWTLADRWRYRGEHPEVRALRRLAEQARWTGGAR